MSTSIGKGALTAGVREDHQEMYEYHENFKALTVDDGDAQQRWVNQLFWEIARHAVGEEIVVYPLMEKHMGEEGKRLADKDRADHQYVKETIYKLQSMHASAPEFAAMLAEMMRRLREHNDSEETKDLPQLEMHLGEQGSKDAAAAFKRTKKFAPTHAHPSAPNKPPFETVVGLMAAPLDKLLDLFKKFPTEDTPKA